MCLAVPGQIKSIMGEDPLMRMAKVSFGGIFKEVNLAYVPEAQVGDYVVVHVGFALSVLDEAEAMQVFEYIRQIDELNGIERNVNENAAGNANENANGNVNKKSGEESRR
jgi:hydrogenase expression/formation protein HypC